MPGFILFKYKLFFLSIASTLSTSGQAQSPSVLEEKTNCWVRQCLLYFMVILFYFFKNFLFIFFNGYFNKVSLKTNFDGV